MFLFDLWVLFLIYSLLKEYKKPLIFLAIYWLNPIVVHEFFSSAHMDILTLPFSLLSLKYFLRKRYLFSTIFLAVAAGFKIWPAAFLPVILWNLWKNKKEFTKNIFVFLSISLVSFIPVIITKIDKSLGFVIYAGRWYNNEAFFRSLHWLVKQVKLLDIADIHCTSCVARWILISTFLVIIIFIIKKKTQNHESYFEKFLLIISIMFLISPTQFPWYCIIHGWCLFLFSDQKYRYFCILRFYPYIYSITSGNILRLSSMFLLSYYFCMK